MCNYFGDSRVTTENRIATRQLLEKWHAGDQDALAELLARHLPWIERQVSARLGAELRRKAETQDFVQDALLETLRYVPRFTLAGGAVFRALMLRIIENILCDRHDWFTARRREICRERPLARDTILDLDPPAEKVASPATLAAADEEEARVRLALELIDPADRHLIVRREWDGWEFARIGAEAGISADAARMRFHRALIRLHGSVQRISEGRLEELLPPAATGDADG